MNDIMLVNRYCIRSATGQYLAAISIIGCKAAFTWTDDMEQVVNLSTKHVAKALSDICNAGGAATIPVKMP